MAKGSGEVGRKKGREKIDGVDPGDKNYLDPHWHGESSKRINRDIDPETIPEDMYIDDGSGRRVKDIIQEARDYKVTEELAPDANERITAPATPGIKGDVSKAYGADPTNKYQVQYEVRELSSLTASNTETGAINPDYPEELQPRDRTRTASKAQVINMASNLVPDVLITEFHSTDRGAPIVDEGGIVESGNARTTALRRASLDYPEKYSEYKTELIERAEERGLDPGEVSKFKEPVLVRVRLGDGANRVEFAREANTASVLAMSITEQSKTDADRMKSGDIINFKIGETDDLGKNITRRDNRDFVRSFMTTVPETERGALMGAGGELTEAGSRRIQAGMFTKVYNDPDLASTHFESTDSNVKNITGGLMGSLGQMAKAEEMIKTGSRSEELSIAGDIAVAVKTYKSIKQRDEMTVEMYLDQGQLFQEGEITPTQKRILGELHTRRRSKTKVTSLISSWANVVQQQPHPGQANIFGDEPTSRENLIDAWLSGSYEGHEQEELF